MNSRQLSQAVHGGLYLIALLLFLAGVACRAGDAGSQPNSITDNPPAAPTTAPAMPAVEPSPTTTTTPPAPPATITAAPTISPAPVVLPPPAVACGLHLPLVVTPAAAPVSELNAAWPDDLAVPDEARPALAYMLANPANVGLAAYWIGREEAGAYLNADIPMPLASVVKLIHLVAYVEAVEAGRLDPAGRVPVADLEAYFLPGSDLRSHPRSLAELVERGLIAGSEPAVPMEELPWMMIRHSSNAATDYLHMLLGQAVIEETALQLGLQSQTAPCPFLGQFLLISNHTRVIDNDAAIQALIDDPALYGREVMQFTEAYSGDAQFREDEGRWYQRARRPAWESQSLFSEHLNAQGSPREYANLMAIIGQEQLGGPYAGFLLRRYLEWPMSVYPVNEELFHMVGYKNGALPGILTTVYYASPKGEGGLVVVALFYRRLPETTYQEWRRSLPHDHLARWLLTDPQAIPALRELLAGE